jgi:hypothetical protein
MGRLLFSEVGGVATDVIQSQAIAETGRVALLPQAKKLLWARQSDPPPDWDTSDNRPAFGVRILGKVRPRWPARSPLFAVERLDQRMDDPLLHRPLAGSGRAPRSRRITWATISGKGIGRGEPVGRSQNEYSGDTDGRGGIIARPPERHHCKDFEAVRYGLNSPFRPHPGRRRRSWRRRGRA